MITARLANSGIVKILYHLLLAPLALANVHGLYPFLLTSVNFRRYLYTALFEIATRREVDLLMQVKSEYVVVGPSIISLHGIIREGLKYGHFSTPMS